MAPSDDLEAHPDGPNARSVAAVTRMRLAIAAASRDGSNRTELEEAARDLVAELKNACLPPEQMLLQIKRILAEAGLRPSYANPNETGAHTGPDATVYRDVIAWSIRHYYDGDGVKGN